MTRHELRALLDEVPDTGELVIRRCDPADAQLAAFRQAQSEAADAYDRWASGGGRAAYAGYRAAQDRADAAQDAVTSWAPPRDRAAAAGRAPAPRG